MPESEQLRMWSKKKNVNTEGSHAVNKSQQKLPGRKINQTFLRESVNKKRVFNGQADRKGGGAQWANLGHHVVELAN